MDRIIFFSVPYLEKTFLSTGVVQWICIDKTAVGWLYTSVVPKLLQITASKSEKTNENQKKQPNKEPQPSKPQNVDDKTALLSSEANSRK